MRGGVRLVITMIGYYIFSVCVCFLCNFCKIISSPWGWPVFLHHGLDWKRCPVEYFISELKCYSNSLCFTRFLARKLHSIFSVRILFVFSLFFFCLYIYFAFSLLFLLQPLSYTPLLRDCYIYSSYACVLQVQVLPIFVDCLGNGLFSHIITVCSYNIIARIREICEYLVSLLYEESLLLYFSTNARIFMSLFIRYYSTGVFHSISSILLCICSIKKL